jgi:hypothetical protein
VLASPNARVAARCEDVQWAMLPDGAHGIAPPGGNPGVGEEGHAVALASGGVFIVMRTAQGVLGAAATRDDSGAGGWGESHWATFSARGLPAAAGRPLKNPEGPITLKRFANGKYLLLFYFNSVPGYLARNSSRNPRNPYWLAAGWEEGDGEVRFSQPEVALHYAPLGVSSAVGPGYPDFIEDGDAGVFITETNKTQARVHPVDAAPRARGEPRDRERPLRAARAPRHGAAPSPRPAHALRALAHPRPAAGRVQRRGSHRRRGGGADARAGAPRAGPHHRDGLGALGRARPHGRAPRAPRRRGPRR